MYHSKCITLVILSVVGAVRSLDSSLAAYAMSGLISANDCFSRIKRRPHEYRSEVCHPGHDITAEQQQFGVFHLLRPKLTKEYVHGMYRYLWYTSWIYMVIWNTCISNHPASMSLTPSEKNIEMFKPLSALSSTSCFIS